MSGESHRPRAELAAEQKKAQLVELLVEEVDRAYATTGRAGVLSAIRDLFGRLSTPVLTTMAYERGLVAEPLRENEPEDRR
jgi:hypothetical protein